MNFHCLFNIVSSPKHPECTGDKNHAHHGLDKCVMFGGDAIFNIDEGEGKGCHQDHQHQPAGDCV